MRTLYTLLLFSITLFSFAQNREFNINWNGSQVLETEIDQKKIPSSDDSNINYSEDEGLFFYAEWQYQGASTDVNIINPKYEIIDRTQLYDIGLESLPNTLKYQFGISNARGLRNAALKVFPIIYSNGQIQRLVSFELEFNLASRNGSIQGRNFEGISNSVLSSGNWYRFYIDQSGVYRLSRSFLSNLGISVNNIDPRTIRIFGNGGEMIPLSNAVEYPIDPVENAIKVIGEEDGSFDSGDYVLFYGLGPNGRHQHDYNNQFNSNLNLFEERTYYYLNVGATFGKRVQQLSQPDAEVDFEVTTFQDYQFFEEDTENLVKIGRRWFGEDFDLENEKEFEFSFPNLVSSEPVKVEMAFGSIAPFPSQTSMNININGTSSLLNLIPVDLTGSVLASASTFKEEVLLNSDDITVNITYNDASNPIASGYLDYINIEATRSLRYANNQLVFQNSVVETNSGVVQYTLENTSQLMSVWDITDIYNVGSYDTNGQPNFSFKTNAGELRKYVGFSINDVLSPKRDNNSRVANQNIKGSIFQNRNGEFQDVDYIIISPENFLSQAERLADINRNIYGLSIKVVSLSSIYNEFSVGNQDIAAIRNFIRYVYHNASSSASRLKYVCLFGDGSYDYKDRIANNTNIMPPWYSENSFSLTGSFVSDDFYTMMDENEGEMSFSDRMDIAIGRILAETPQRAKEMVDKIDSYYQDESFGDWRNNILLISDDVDERWERILQETTDNIGTAVEAEKPFFNSIKIHSDAFQQESSASGDRYPDVTDEMIDRITVGASVVNYFGHGGEDGLAKERIFIKNDAQELNNICKYNCFVTVTCEYSKFDDPNRITAGEFTFWNKNGGAINLVTTTRQIFVTVGVAYNVVLERYLFAFGSNDYPTVAEALRLTKTDPNIAGSSQKRLVYFIGDPAMKLAFPKPSIQLTQINDLPLGQANDTLKSLSYTKLSGQVLNESGQIQTDFNGILTATVFDKSIERQTLANDGITDGQGNLIKLDYSTLGNIVFKGKATITNGQFDFDFVVPKDIGIPVGEGKVSFYAKRNNSKEDYTGFSFDIKVGGINNNAVEDNMGPVINLFMNDENFVSGGITNESPTLLAKLQDENGINTASGIGHDIVAILDGDETNPIVLNDYYQAEVDDFTNGVLSFPFRDIEPGLHTLTLKAWDVYNNSSISEIQFNVFDEDEELVITNVLNYPNPFVDYTEFWFNHNSSDELDISVQIFTVSGKIVRTLNGQTTGGNKSTASLSKDIIWDGRDDFGEKIGKGVYIYKLKVKSNRLNKQVEKIQKLVIL